MELITGQVLQGNFTDESQSLCRGAQWQIGGGNQKEDLRRYQKAKPKVLGSSREN